MYHLVRGSTVQAGHCADELRGRCSVDRWALDDQADRWCGFMRGASTPCAVVELVGEATLAALAVELRAVAPSVVALRGLSDAALAMALRARRHDADDLQVRALRRILNAPERG
jgi:hypothetical protein